MLAGVAKSLIFGTVCRPVLGFRVAMLCQRWLGAVDIHFAIHEMNVNTPYGLLSCELVICPEYLR